MTSIISTCRPHTQQEYTDALNRAPHFFDNTLTKIACSIIPFAGMLLYIFAQEYYANEHDNTDNQVVKASMIKHLVDYDICMLINSVAILAMSILGIFVLPVVGLLSTAISLTVTGVLIYKLLGDCEVLNFYPKIEE
ncbi:MAG: hypothetical protein FJZ56_07375 [Chlamydiae bacterium]|nr:hypothetical protein [Chlamydiota bacterium]